ncbi:MAG: ATP-binding protein [Verrucomicrobia bacterium]|nr:ATP-binding protein [Verrucomicrobiota bacterium]
MSSPSVFVPLLRRLTPRAAALLLAGAAGLSGLQAAPDPEAGRPLLQTFTPRDYRAHQQIWMGAQAPDGVMWFGNSHSVLSYDGAAWRRIEVPGTSWVRTLAFGPDDRLYIGGTDQLGFIAPGPDGAPRFTSLLEKLPPAQRSPGVIWSMTVTRDAVWFATETVVLRWRDGAFHAWPFVNKPRQQLTRVGDDLFLHRQGVGLFRLVGDDFVLVSDAPEIVGSQFCIIEPDGERGLRLGLAAGPFFHLRNGRLTRFPTPVDALLARTKLRFMIRLPSGARALGTTSLGVIVTDADFNFVSRLSTANGLESEQLLSLTPDREGGVWLGTGNGVVRAELGSAFTVFDRPNGLPRNLTHDLRRHAGTLYAATPDGVLRLKPADAATGTPAQFEPTPDGPREVCWSLASHPSGLLFATASGVLQFAGAGPPRLVFETTEGVSKLAAVRGRPDDLFVGRFLGLNLLRYEAGRWRDLGGVPGLKTEVRTIAEATDGALWLGTPTRGFIRVVRPAGAAVDDWTHSTFVAYREDHGLPKDQGWSHVYNLGDHVVFVTDVGTYRYDSAANRFILDESFQIPGRHSRTQLWPLAPTDHPSAVWAQPDTEETEIPRQLGRLTLHPTGPADFAPLPTKILDRVAFGGARSLAWERVDGRDYLWLGGPDALVRADLSVTVPPLPAWNVLLRTLTLPDGTQLTPARGTAAPRFAYARAPLVFSFSAPHFGSGPGTKFQTRLLGYDDAWQPWSPRTEAEFTNLSGGPFTFEVRAQDADGKISEPARFTFSVAPPWHLSPAAYALYLLAAAGVIFAYIRWRLGRTERERARLERLVATRTAELASARDAAESANRAKSAFLASMSHELRTPLNGVIGYAQVLQADHRLAPDQQERVRIVQSSGEHLLRMINDVLDLAKIEAGKLTVRPAPCALGDLLRDIAAAHAPAAAAKQLSFHLDLAPTLPAWVECDAQKLRQVLDNLLGNAVKFTATGSVTLRVSPSVSGSPLLGFSVTDTGPGISAADQARLFHAFEQANDARPDAPGAGLGLAISRALVERLGGSLTLTSAPGAGSTFAFSLPLPAIAPAAPTRSTGQRIAGYEGDRRRVLIVDDHDINRRLLVDLLAPLGFDCGDFAAPQTALARLTEGAEPWPDLAIVDVRMTGLDGLAFTRALRDLPRGPQLRILLSSASVLSFNPTDGHRAGADAFIAKPFRTSELLEKIGALLALRWRDAESAPPFPLEPSVSPLPLPEPVRLALREHLAHGDLEALRLELAALRPLHPGAELATLEEAAARFDLARLRALLG